MGCQTGWLYWFLVCLNCAQNAWAGVTWDPWWEQFQARLFGARPLCSLDCCCRCLLWSHSWAGCSSRPGGLLSRSVPSVEVSHGIPSHVVRDQYLSEFKNQLGKFMGEACTWGKVWGSQALTQEVPKPVISGDWKQIPKNFCVLLTLFSYFGLYCWKWGKQWLDEADAPYLCVFRKFHGKCLRNGTIFHQYPQVSFPPWQKNTENHMDADWDDVICLCRVKW